MPATELIVEMLTADLSAPRILLDQVVNYISDYYGFSSVELPRFFHEKFPELEDYEIDLTFSPQYTPAEHNRLEYIPILGAKHLSIAEVALIKQRLADAQLETYFKIQDRDEEIRVPVHEVFIDRYVNLLKLDQKLPSALYEGILANVPEASHHEVNLLAREDVWHSESRQQILLAFLSVFKHRNNCSTLKVSYLTNFVRTYRPTGLLDMERQFESLIESCKLDMENVQGRGFHDEYLKAVNVGNNLTAGTERGIWEHYQHMMDLAAQLKDDYQHISEAAPALWEQARQQQPV